MMTGSFMGRGNQYIQFVKVLYCNLLTNGKQLPAFPLEVGLGIDGESATTLPAWPHLGEQVGFLFRSVIKQVILYF